MASGTPIPPLTNKQKQDWNMFIDFMDKQGYKGKPELDDRNTDFGRYMFQKFAAHTPGVTITYADVPRVQKEIQDYRNNLIQQYKAGKLEAGYEIKDPETDIMPGVSKIDGWLGSKTSSYKFPTAVAVGSDGKPVNYGVDVAAYDKDRGLNK